jgi:hypothetical protein
MLFTSPQNVLPSVCRVMGPQRQSNPDNAVSKMKTLFRALARATHAMG